MLYAMAVLSVSSAELKALQLAGTMLWADLWAVPANAKNALSGDGPSPLLPVWLDFCLQPQRLAAHRGLRQGAAPCLLPQPLSMQPPHPRGGESGSGQNDRSVDVLIGAEAAAKGNQGMDSSGAMPADSVLQRSEFLLPQDDEMRDVMWQALHPAWNKTHV